MKRATETTSVTPRPEFETGDERRRLTSHRQQRSWPGRVLVFATCVLLANAVFGDRGLAESMRTRRVIQQIEADVARVKHENAGLREQVRRLQSDPDTIESVARAELGLIKPGEVLVVVKDLH